MSLCPSIAKKTSSPNNRVERHSIQPYSKDHPKICKNKTNQRKVSHLTQFILQLNAIIVLWYLKIVLLAPSWCFWLPADVISQQIKCFFVQYLWKKIEFNILGQVGWVGVMEPGQLPPVWLGEPPTVIAIKCFDLSNLTQFHNVISTTESEHYFQHLCVQSRQPLHYGTDIDNGHEKLEFGDPENFTFILASWTLFLLGQGWN